MGCAVKLIAGVPDILLPSYIEVPTDYDEASFAAELSLGGHQVRAFLFGQRAVAVAFPVPIVLSSGFHYMFCNEDDSDVEGAFLHTASAPMSYVSFGHHAAPLQTWILARSCFTHTTQLHSNLARVIFKNQAIQMFGNYPETKRSIGLASTATWG